MIRLSLASIAGALALTGCASVNMNAPVEYSVDKNREFNLPYETTWIKAVDWFADHDVTIEKIEKTSGLLTAKYLIKANDEYLDCGHIEATGTLEEPTIEKLGSLNVTVREIGANTTKVNVNFFGEFKLTARDAWDGRPIRGEGRCVSTGELEKSILDYVGR
jgi:hypothetical protein